MQPMKASADSFPSIPRGPRDVTLTTDLEGFVAAHSGHGYLEGDIGPLATNGYRHAVACSCGATFQRWIVPRRVVGDLTLVARGAWRH
jgi:hypothetical protein